MAEIKVPMTQKSFFKTQEEVKSGIHNSVLSKYNAQIKKISALTGVPESVLASFVFIESNGNAKAKGGISIGLMQINPSTAADALYKEVEQGRLSQGERAVLNQYLGTRMKKFTLPSGKKKFPKYDYKVITESDLFKPELNLLLGGIKVRQLMDFYTDKSKGVIRMDKVIVEYNTGVKTTKRVRAQQGNTDAILAMDIPSITKNYIKKFVGANGTLDVLV